MKSALPQTRTRLFLLNELATWGRRSFESRYTLSLRILEEHGYVRLARGNWSLTKRGRETLKWWAS